MCNTSLNPLKRVNSILTASLAKATEKISEQSQSPQTGQFNSYGFVMPLVYVAIIVSQSPQTGQFNSYLVSCI